MGLFLAQSLLQRYTIRPQAPYKYSWVVGLHNCHSLGLRSGPFLCFEPGSIPSGTFTTSLSPTSRISVLGVSYSSFFLIPLFFRLYCGHPSTILGSVVRLRNRRFYADRLSCDRNESTPKPERNPTDVVPDPPPFFCDLGCGPFGFFSSEPATYRTVICCAFPQSLDSLLPVRTLWSRGAFCALFFFLFFFLTGFRPFLATDDSPFFKIISRFLFSLSASRRL